MPATLNTTAPVGTFKNALGEPLASGTISFLVTDSFDHPIPCRSAGQVLATAGDRSIVNGGMADATQVPNPAESSPINVRLRITVTDNVTGDSTIFRNVTPIDDGTGAWNLATANLNPDLASVLVEYRQGKQGDQGFPGDATHVLLKAAFVSAGTQVFTHNLGTMFPACSIYYVSGITSGVVITPINRTQIQVTAPGQALLVIACTGGSEPHAGLIRNWQMDEQFGSISIDSVSAEVLTYSAAPAWAGLSTPAYPNFGIVPIFPLTTPSGAFTADRTGLDFDRSSSFACSAWVYLDDPNTTQYILHALDNNSTGYGFYIANQALNLQLIADIPSSNYCEYHTGGVVPQAAATHIGFSFDGTTQTCVFYVNGQRVGASKNGNLTGSIVGGATNVAIGATRGGGQPVRQILARVRIYNAVPNDAEFAARFNNRD